MVLECRDKRRIADVNADVGHCPHGWSKLTHPIAACRTPHDNASCCPTHMTCHIAVVIGVQKGTPNGWLI